MMSRLFLLLLSPALLMLSSCASGISNLSLIAPAGVNGTVEEIMIVTNRSPDIDPKVRFSGQRNNRLSYATMDVWVPRDREAGEMRFPYGKIDPDKHFSAVRYSDVSSEQAFLSQLNAKLAKIPDASMRRVIIYVHGYNVDFGEGVLRHAQISHDFGIEGTPLLFSWPSAGELSRYLYDRDSAHFSRDALAATLELVSRSNAESIMVFAHSMGTFLTMETLRQLSLDDRSDILNKIEPLVLASPDIDMDVFRAQLGSVQPAPKNIITLVSKRDSVLRLSERLRGGHDTVGKGDQISELQGLGLTVVDMSKLEDSFSIAHNTFAESPTLLRLIQNGRLGKLLKGADDHEDRDSGVGALSDLAASIIYLPARMLGDR